MPPMFAPAVIGPATPLLRILCKCFVSSLFLAKCYSNIRSRFDSYAKWCKLTLPIMAPIVFACYFFIREQAKPFIPRKMRFWSNLQFKRFKWVHDMKAWWRGIKVETFAARVMDSHNELQFCSLIFFTNAKGKKGFSRWNWLIKLTLSIEIKTPKGVVAPWICYS